MNILITGGCGFIGSHLVEYHLQKGDYVQIIDNLSTGSLQNINFARFNPHCICYQDDILQWSGLKKAVKWADRIYHLSAVVGMYCAISEPLQTLQTNINSCAHLLETILKTKAKPQLLIASSSAVYGPSKRLKLKESDSIIINSPQERFSYAISKLATESLAIGYFEKYGISSIVLRIFNTIGPRQVGSYGMVVPCFVEQACHNQPLVIFGNGQQTRSFCDVRDLIAACNRLAETCHAGCELVNVGSEEEITINQLALLVKNLADSSSPLHYIAASKAYHRTFTEIKRRRPDLTKLYQLTGFKHQWTLKKTLQDLIRNYRQSDLIKNTIIAE